jgi:hypothetical protein
MVRTPWRARTAYELRDLCDGVALDKAFRDGNDEVAGVIEAIGTAIDDEIGASLRASAIMR